MIVSLFADRCDDGPDWMVCAIAAGIVGIEAALAADLHSSTSVYSGVAILPLAPGLTLSTGMLVIARGDSSAAGSALDDAGVVSLS